MIRTNPNSSFERTQIAEAVRGAYPNVREEVGNLIKGNASPEVIRDMLLSHIGIINPTLEQELRTADTESIVMDTIQALSSGFKSNNGVFNTAVANGDRLELAA